MGVAEELYHAALPIPGEQHLLYFGPVVWGRGEGMVGYLVLSTMQLIFVTGPQSSVGRFYPYYRVFLENVGNMSLNPGMSMTYLSINQETFVVHHEGNPTLSAAMADFRGKAVDARTRRLEWVREYQGRVARGRPDQAGSVQREREVIREIVKMPCRYCGQLVAVTDLRCGSCGASLGH
jgi:hypothetical protein